MEIILFALLIVGLIVRESQKWNGYKLPEKGCRIQDKQGNVYVVKTQWWYISLEELRKCGRNDCGVYAVPEGGGREVKFDLFDFEKGRVKIVADKK